MNDKPVTRLKKLMKCDSLMPQIREASLTWMALPQFSPRNRKSGSKPVKVALLPLECLYCAGVRGIAVDQQHQDHLQVGLDRQPAPRRQRRQLGTDAQHKFQYLAGNSCLRRDDMEETPSPGGGRALDIRRCHFRPHSE